MVQISVLRTVMQWFTAWMNASVEAVLIFKSYMHVCVCVFFKHNLFMDMKIFLFFFAVCPLKYGEKNVCELVQGPCSWTVKVHI